MSKEEEYKLTITLSRKALATLDWLKEMSGFGSRGRTIEEAILAIWDLADNVESWMSAYLKRVQEGKSLDFAHLYPFLVNVSTKLARFGSPSEYRERFKKE